MIYLISGASHTGKTVLAQRLLERLHVPYLSLDHLKMGLIRSGMTTLTPADDDRMTGFLFPIAAEMIKTAIENSQHLIVEGCYIPADWPRFFPSEYRDHIRSICLIMTERHICEHFAMITAHASDVEHRLDDSYLSPDWLIRINADALADCNRHGAPYVLIDGDYPAAIAQAEAHLTR